MTASRDPDRLIQAFLREGDEELQDQVYDAVRSTIEQTRQRAGFGPWRFPRMNRFMAVGAGAVAVLALLFAGAQLFGSPGNNVGGGDDATPTPQPASPSPVAVTLASGSFTAPLGEFGEAVEIEAVRTGDDVSGTMEISDPAGGAGAYSVDVQCARTTDGVHLIGGEVTESTYEEFIEEGAYVVLAFAPGTPVRVLWSVDVLVADEVPAPAESCSAFVDFLLDDPSLAEELGDLGRPIDGELELGE